MDMTGMGIGMWIFWLIIFIVFVLVVMLLISTGNRQISTSAESPIDILKKRYANGDIDEEKYHSMKKELED
ncbi:MAG: SHOCT domain-containing protein [Gammaproteobacteria bacterium]|jgi:putative membrane protein